MTLRGGVIGADIMGADHAGTAVGGATVSRTARLPSMADGIAMVHSEVIYLVRH